MPISGSRRCQFHCGPVGARRFYERQVEAFERGEISPEAFYGLKARREANHLRYVWRRSPWTAGRTLDLGPHEEAFRADLALLLGRELADLSPATLDAARWRWRRHMVDRRQPERWQAWVSGPLVQLVHEDGDPPDDFDPAASAALPAAFKVEARPTAFSKRTQLDRPRPAKPAMASRRRGRAPKPAPVPEGQREDLEAYLVRNWPELRAVLEGVEDLASGLRVAAAHRRLASAPEDDEAALRAWLHVVAEVRQRRAGG